jgi:hypothetical protein
MPRYYLAYATANESRRFFLDSVNFERLVARAPGVEGIELFIAISEVRRRSSADDRAVGELLKILAREPRIRVRQVAFKPNTGRDMSSYAHCLDAIAAEAAADDYVLCLNRSAFGPMRDDWYGAFVRQFGRDEHIGLCGNSINFSGYPDLPDRGRFTHVQTYCFLGRPRVLAPYFARLPALRAQTKEETIRGGEIELSRAMLRDGLGLSCLAWPEHVFFEPEPYHPSLPVDNISADLETTAFRHWDLRDYGWSANFAPWLRWNWRLARGA